MKRDFIKVYQNGVQCVCDTGYIVETETFIFSSGGWCSIFGFIIKGIFNNRDTGYIVEIHYLIFSLGGGIKIKKPII